MGLGLSSWLRGGRCCLRRLQGVQDRCPVSNCRERLRLRFCTLQSANALTFDQLQGLTYLQVKGTGIANTCPTLDSGSSNVKDLKPGTYKLGKFCMEPTSFTVKEESQVGLAGSFHRPLVRRMLAFCIASFDPAAVNAMQFKGGDAEFVPTKLMTRLTYTLDEARRPTLDVARHCLPAHGCTMPCARCCLWANTRAHPARCR